jgi:hypothetical protein
LAEEEVDDEEEEELSTELDFGRSVDTDKLFAD